MSQINNFPIIPVDLKTFTMSILQHLLNNDFNRSALQIVCLSCFATRHDSPSSLIEPHFIYGSLKIYADCREDGIDLACKRWAILP